eukprot:51751-Hanusia_phi.AAC.3
MAQPSPRQPSSSRNVLLKLPSHSRANEHRLIPPADSWHSMWDLSKGTRTLQTSGQWIRGNVSALCEHEGIEHLRAGAAPCLVPWLTSSRGPTWTYISTTGL